MAAMNFFFCGMHVYVFVLAALITLSTWGSWLRWLGLVTSLLALLIALAPVFNPIWLVQLQLPAKVAILIGALAMTILTKKNDTRYIGFLLMVAAGGAVFAQLVTI